MALMTPRLYAYLQLEQGMIRMDDSGDGATADRMRDLMEPLWYALSESERASCSVPFRSVSIKVSSSRRSSTSTDPCGRGPAVRD